MCFIILHKAFLQQNLGGNKLESSLISNFVFYLDSCFNFYRQLFYGAHKAQDPHS